MRVLKSQQMFPKEWQTSSDGERRGSEEVSASARRAAVRGSIICSDQACYDSRLDL